jgi:hypothetical protein
MVVNNSITQLHNCTPDQLTETILQGVENKFKEFKKQLEPTNRETYLTRLQTAKMLSISLTTLNDWSNKGLCKSYKYGNRTYYKLSEIETNLNNSNTL